MLNSWPPTDYSKLDERDEGDIYAGIEPRHRLEVLISVPRRCCSANLGAGDRPPEPWLRCQIRYCRRSRRMMWMMTMMMVVVMRRGIGRQKRWARRTPLSQRFGWRVSVLTAACRTVCEVPPSLLPPPPPPLSGDQTSHAAI